MSDLDERASGVLVVGFDRHPAASAALTTAAGLAVRLRAGLLVLHVIDLEDHPIDPDAADWETEADTAVAAEREQAGAILAGHPLPWAFHVERGDPARHLIDTAARHHATMIVIGTARTGVGAHLLTGSVAKRVLRHTERPVLLVPEHPSR
ncbi:universal stress protein [Spongiactinospora sp. TRM90649]|uniref:universal stress protein n=1 Tax=Spongiactinospora sp. TRM90649 TaxID=3031114 RepID=UPI0023F93E50|nr:universal stress protein [Spongiactinospora sp. TRM90649]MDF5754375.1 universal stress protein [Spongiactinospora sp. TRM90649]